MLFLSKSTPAFDGDAGYRFHCTRMDEQLGQSGESEQLPRGPRPSMLRSTAFSISFPNFMQTFQVIARSSSFLLALLGL